MPDPWAISEAIAKMLLYLGFAGAAGLVLILVLFADLVSPFRKTIRVQIVVLAVMALAASFLGFCLRAAALTGEISGIADPEMLNLLWQTPVGEAFVSRIIGATLIVLGIALPLFGKWIALAGGLLSLWSFTQIGHVLALEMTSARFMLFLHLLGIAFWIGVLGPLRSLSRHPDHLSQAAALGHRFGQIASILVPTLILAGLLMAWLLVGDLHALVTTSYGRVLLIKMGLVSAILTLAAMNKLRFVPAMQTGDLRAAHHLVRSIEIETAIFLVAIAVTAMLTSFMAVPN